MPTEPCEIYDSYRFADNLPRAGWSWTAGPRCPASTPNA